MKTMFRNFFSFSSLERKGVVVLIILILLVTAFNFYLVHHQPKTDQEDQTLFMLELQAFERELTAKKDAINRGNLDDSAWPSDEISKGKFVSQARRITFNPIAVRVPVCINVADSGDFEKLPGIGPVLARRIVRYRALLGGFYDREQIREVYGISDSLYTRIKESLLTDSVAIKKINLNEATEYDLARHPYIGKYTARGIISYRSRVHTIKDLKELTVNGLITAEMLEKLEKYLFI